MIALIGDILMVAGTWAFMGQNPKIATMPLALYEKLQMLHPMMTLLLPLGAILALIGRVSWVLGATHKLRAAIAAIFSIGRLPLIEGLACIGAFALLYTQLTATEMSGMLAWIAITLSIGIGMLWISRKIYAQ